MSSELLGLGLVMWEAMLSAAKATICGGVISNEISKTDLCERYTQSVLYIKTCITSTMKSLLFSTETSSCFDVYTVIHLSADLSQLDFLNPISDSQIV
jgi:hypothetical protein